MASGTRWTSDDAIRAQERIASNRIDVIKNAIPINTQSLPLPKDFVKITGIAKSVSLTLFGIPMPKQSVRGYATGRKNANGSLIVDHFQPKKMTDRTDDYINQIKEQLPKGFIPFQKKVHITKLHYIYPPLKKFSTKKGVMERIRAGELIKKLTRPDLGDNLAKLVLDSMSEVVYRDDSIIWAIDNVRKYHGTGGMIIIELTGI